MTEQQVIARYGKNSTQHKQYKAVMVESELIHKHGKFSAQVKEYRKYMRKIGIPVI